MPSRKPIQPPAPKLTRPLAQQSEPKNPITQEIMHRVRKVLRQRQISAQVASDEISVSYGQFREWIGTRGKTPYGDNLHKIERWLNLWDASFFQDLFGKKIRFRGGDEDRLPPKYAA